VGVHRQLIAPENGPQDPAIEERFREYDDSIVPILSYLNKEGFKVLHVNSERKPEVVEADIEKALGI
jgi:adenylate kinase family enzyme